MDECGFAAAAGGGGRPLDLLREAGVVIFIIFEEDVDEEPAEEAAPAVEIEEHIADLVRGPSRGSSCRRARGRGARSCWWGVRGRGACSC